MNWYVGPIHTVVVKTNVGALYKAPHEDTHMATPTAAEAVSYSYISIYPCLMNKYTYIYMAVLVMVSHAEICIVNTINLYVYFAK